MGKTAILIGQKFNKLTVISRSGSRHNAAAWLCKCECGNTRIAKGSDLKLGKTVSCGCGRIGKNSFLFSGYKDIGNHYWGHVLSNARKRGLEFSITKEYAWNLFEQQNRKCALSGLDIALHSSSSNVPKLQTASLDRIDNCFGYIDGNVQWLHKHVNKMKNVHDQKYFIDLCKIIALRNK